MKFAKQLEDGSPELHALYKQVRRRRRQPAAVVV